jgi:DNA polymerase III subunit epsilon
MSSSELFTKPIDELIFSVVDTETTGMHPEFCKVMDVGIVTLKGGKVVGEWETLINPKQEVPFWITKYTHLTTKHVKYSSEFSEHAKTITDKLAGTIFVGHNVNFDYYFLYHEMKRLGLKFEYPKLCTVLLARKLLPKLAGANLDILSDYYGIKISQRHRALPDAQATAVVLKNFIEIAKEKYGAKTYYDLERLQHITVSRSPISSAFNRLFSDL